MKYRPQILLLAVYIISRLFWWSRGLEFDAYGIGGMGEPTHLMQLYPIEALQSNLWETLWYGHMQPPIYSLFLYVVGFNPNVVHVIYIVIGMATILCLYRVLLSLNILASVSFFVACVWIVLPSAILYEQTIIYTHPIMALLVLSAWSLQRNHMVLFSSTCVCITMTRSMFHPLVWLLSVLLIGWYKNERAFTKTN